jgi:hypothetical protein
MSETLTAPEEITRRTQDIVVQGTQLNNAMWGIDEEIKQPVQTQEQVAEKKDEVVETKTEPIFETKADDTEILDPKDWLKREFEIEDIEVLKAERAELKKLKETKPEEIKFADETSKQIYDLLKDGKRKEVREFLQTQEQLESLTTSEITKDNAADIIKLKMQLSNKLLTKDDIEFQYKQEYVAPKEPVQRATEDTEDFEERLNDWKERVTTIEMKRVVAAKMAIPELEQLKSKLVLPDIQPQQQQRQLSQEELDVAKKFDEAYLNSVNDSLKNFNGFSVKVKNEAVGLPEISIPYVAIDSEKGYLSQELADFAKNGYNSNYLFASDWVNEDGSINTKQIAEDRYLLKNRDRILQKVAEEAATKGVEAYIKGKKNIDLNQQNQQGTAVITKEDKTELDVVRDSFFG